MHIFLIKKNPFEDYFTPFSCIEVYIQRISILTKITYNEH